MHIDVQVTDLSLSDSVREYLDRRARFALSRLSGRIRRVVLHLADINGPRGGVDKRCTVHVHLQSAPVVVIEEADSDVYRVLDRALSRAGRAATKRVERSHQFDRQGAVWAADDTLSEIRDRRRRLPITRTTTEHE